MPYHVKLHRVALILALIAAFAAPAARADTSVGGTISQPTTWTLANSPYSVTNTTVSDGVTLVIEPGVELRFASTHGMTVYGKLVADGTLADPIVFRNTNPTWQVGTITLYDSDPGTIVDSCRFTNFAGIDITGTGASHSPTVSNCFMSCVSTNWGIEINNSNPVIISNTIHAYNGIYFASNNAYRLLPVIQENAVSHNESTYAGQGIYVSLSAISNIDYTIRDCHVRGFSYGVFYYGAVGYNHAWNNTVRVDGCILYNNDDSVRYRVEHPSYGSYNGAITDSWIKDVFLQDAPITTVTCTANYWTTDIPDRSNTTSKIEYVSDRGTNPFEEGDVNADGVTNQADAEMIMDYLVGNRTLGSLPNAADADADGDADVDMRDATLIRAFYEGLLLKIPR